MLPAESRVFEKDVGGVSYSETGNLRFVPAERTLEPIEDRLNASSMTFSSSVLTLRASLEMYLLGLTGLRTRRRGSLGIGATDRAARIDEVSAIVGGGEESSDVIAESLERLRNLRCSGVYCGPPVLAVKALAIELRFKWEKLTPRFPRLLGRPMTGGLLGQTELVIEDLEIDLLCATTERWERLEGVLRFEEFRERIELCRLEFAIACTRNELPVR